MAHKVHPKAYRIRRIGDWNSRGFYKKPAESLEEDFRIREFLKKKLEKVGIEKIEIERFPGKINIIISSARPGLIIGRGGEGIEQLKKGLEQKVLEEKAPFYIIADLRKTAKRKSAKARKKEKTLSKKFLFETEEPGAKKEIRIEIRVIKDPWTSANLSAQWVARQIEKRIHHRRVLKRALSKISAHKEIEGARIEVSGRLNGVEIARREWGLAGKLPRQTIRADIDYAKAEACCTYGVIGVKVWIYKGEKFE